MFVGWDQWINKMYQDTDFSPIYNVTDPSTVTDYFGPWMEDPTRSKNFVSYMIFNFPSPRYEVY